MFSSLTDVLIKLQNNTSTLIYTACYAFLLIHFLCCIMPSVCSGIIYLVSTFPTAPAQNECFSGTIVQFTACWDGERTGKLFRLSWPRGLLKHRAAISASKVMPWLKQGEITAGRVQRLGGSLIHISSGKRGSSGQDLAPMQQVLKISVFNNTFLLVPS